MRRVVGDGYGRGEVSDDSDGYGGRRSRTIEGGGGMI